MKHRLNTDVRRLDVEHIEGIKEWIRKNERKVRD